MIKTSQVLVKDFMESIPSIKPNMEIAELVKLMKTERTTFLPVVDSTGKLIGGVFDYNLIKLVKQESISPLAGSVWTDVIDKAIAGTPVGDIMDTKIVTVQPTDSIDAALKVMNSNDARMLNVVDKDGKFLGVLRIRTVFHKLLSEAE
jgi:CBS domain-containing protein